MRECLLHSTRHHIGGTNRWHSLRLGLIVMGSPLLYSTLFCFCGYIFDIYLQLFYFFLECTYDVVIGTKSKMHLYLKEFSNKVLSLQIVVVVVVAVSVCCYC